MTVTDSHSTRAVESELFNLNHVCGSVWYSLYGYETNNMAFETIFNSI